MYLCNIILSLRGDTHSHTLAAGLHMGNRCWANTETRAARYEIQDTRCDQVVARPFSRRLRLCLPPPAFFPRRKLTFVGLSLRVFAWFLSDFGRSGVGRGGNSCIFRIRLLHFYRIRVRGGRGLFAPGVRSSISICLSIFVYEWPSQQRIHNKNNKGSSGKSSVGPSTHKRRERKQRERERATSKCAREEAHKKEVTKNNKHLFFRFFCCKVE